MVLVDGGGPGDGCKRLEWASEGWDGWRWGGRPVPPMRAGRSDGKISINDGVQGGR